MTDGAKPMTFEIDATNEHLIRAVEFFKGLPPAEAEELMIGFAAGSIVGNATHADGTIDDQAVMAGFGAMTARIMRAVTAIWQETSDRVAPAVREVAP